MSNSYGHEQWRKQVRSLAMLEVNWNSYNAASVSPIAMRLAERLIDVVQFLMDVQFREPRAISALPDGGVLVMWRTTLYEINVEVLRDGTLDVLVASRETDEVLVEVEVAA